MAKKDLIEKEGVVIESLPAGMFKVSFPDGTESLATISGKMRMHYIKIFPGDKVKVEFVPYDLKRGRITYRSK